jgi:hypothetical protein
MSDNYGKNTDTLATCNTYCFFTENKLIKSAFNVVLRVQYMAVLVFACSYGLSVIGLMAVELAYLYVIKD